MYAPHQTGALALNTSENCHALFAISPGHIDCQMSNQHHSSSKKEFYSLRGGSFYFVKTNAKTDHHYSHLSTHRYKASHFNSLFKLTSKVFLTF